MKMEEAKKLMEDRYVRRTNIRFKKAHDYAKEDADIHSNFKVMADLYKWLKEHGYDIPMDKPHGVAFWHLLHKIVRILNLWNEDKKPENEGLKDSHDDLANYNDLAEECYIEWKRNQ